PRAPGLYTVTERVQGGWLATIPSAAPSYDVTLDGSHVNVTNLVFANFRLATISGKVYDDANRNGVLDGSESALINYPIYLSKDNVQISRITSSFTGDYSFPNLVAGNYAVSESIRTAGYQLSFPPFPGVYTFTPLSGDNLAGNNFGNYVATTNSMTIRTFSDQDGSFATLGDARPKSWNLKLYRDSVAPGSLLKDTTASALTVGSLAPGVYIVTEADSAGWLNLGLVRDATAIPRHTGTDTVALASGQSHAIDFLKFNPGRLVVRKLADADGLTSTATDRNTIPWNLSLYQGFIAPGNLIRSVASAESLFVDSLPKGTYVAVESDSAGWKHIGTLAGPSGGVVSESSSVSSKQFTLSAVVPYRVDFVNANAGSLEARTTRDTDGRFATGGDRKVIGWPLKLYKGTVSPANLIASVNAESLIASNIGPGVYVVVESDSTGWSHLGTTLDGSDSAGSQHSISINVVRNHKSVLQFANYYTRNRKVWTASADCEWGNARNWNPQDVPQPPDTVVIPVTSRPCVPVAPPHTSVASISIDPGAALRIPPNDTLFVAGDVRVDGTLLGDPLDSSVIVISGNWIVHGFFDAALSRLVFASNLDQTMSGGSYFSLQIGRDSTATGGRVSILGKTRIGGTLTLHKDLTIVQDTLFMLNDSPGAEEGAGSLKTGTIQRVIRLNTPQPYPFGSRNCRVEFHDGVSNPGKITVGIFSDRLPTDFGSSWSPVGGVADSASNTVTLDSVRKFSRLTSWAFGINQSGIGLPIVRRTYTIDAHGDTGFSARLALHYNQSEVPVGVDESSLILLQQNFAVRDSVAAGWNMVSVPVTPHVLLKSAIFANASSPAFMYSPASGYTVQDTLKPGVGYWLRFNSPQLVDVPGEMITQDTVDLAEGWNLVGTPSFVADVGQISTSPATIVSSKFFGYGGGYYIANTFRPLKSYWVKTSHSGKLFVPAASSQYLGKTEAPISGLSSRKDLSTFSFLDAAGHGQSLYFGSARDINPEMFEMPPQPPSESFDVRFGSNKMLEIYPQDSREIRELHILMQAPVYPLRISWQLANSPRERVTLTDDAGGKLIGKRILQQEGTMLVENPALHRLFLRIDEGRQIPVAFSLKQCYPNPFNPRTTIEFDIPNPARVSLIVYDLLGKEVAVLAENRDYDSGTYTLQFDASPYASGVYFYRLTARSRENMYQKVLKMILLR
ncbi:MAG: T9SS type A sorting domain-containing protein, partial [Ignavibacteria bacterium]